MVCGLNIYCAKLPPAKNIYIKHVYVRVKTYLEVYRMSKGTTAGLILLALGIILWIAYGLILGLEKIMEEINYIAGFIIGIVLIGIVVLIISIVLEQKQSTKEMKEKINKEDLKP